jgi:hypothetical protein
MSLLDGVSDHTGDQGLTKVAGNLRLLSLADSGQQIAACCAEEQAVERHVR